jgi:membrane protein YqaA with SNARE-associated domain
VSDALALLLGLGVGVGSALLPVVNAEAYGLVAGAAVAPIVAGLLALALAIGQTGGKLVLFEAGLRGSDRMAARREKARGNRWAERVRGWLSGPVSGPVTVLAAASSGLPPLAVVSVVAGASGQRRTTFAACCLLGRTARFAALVVPASLLA